MNFEQFIESKLMDVIEDRLHGPDHTQLDVYMYRLAKELTANRFNNEAFDTLINLVLETISDLERVARINVEDQPHKVMDIYFDMITARTMSNNGDVLNKLNDRDYDYLLDLINSPIYAAIYGDSGSNLRGRGGRGYSRDDRRGGRGFSVGGYDDDSGYSRDRGRGYSRDDRRGGYSGGYTDNRPRQNYQRNDYHQPNRYSSRPVRDNGHITKREVGDNDGYAYLANITIEQNRKREEMERQRQDSYQRPAQRTPERPERAFEEERVQSHRETYAEPPKSTQEPVYEYTRPAKVVTKEPVRQEIKLQVPPAHEQGYDHTSEFPYEMFWEDDCLWQASVKTKWKLTGTGIDAYPVLYNMFKFVSYHVMDKYGNITQRFKEVNNDNRYINQTLLKDQDSYADAFTRKIPKVSDIVRNDEFSDVEREDRSKEMDLEDVIDVTQDDFDDLNCFVQADSLASPVIEGRAKIQSGRKSALNLFLVTDPIEGTTKSEADLIKGLYANENLISLSKELLSLKDKISKYNYERINKRISARVLDVVNNVFGVDIKSMDFAEHWPSVIEHLSSLDKYNREWMDNFSRRMNELIPKFICITDTKDVDGNINSAFAGTVTENNVDTVVLFTDYYAILSLDCTLDNLAIGRQLEMDSPLILRPGDDVYSSRALHSILNEVKSTASSNTLLISTRCGALVEVRPYQMDSSNLVLSLFDRR